MGGYTIPLRHPIHYLPQQSNPSHLVTDILSRARPTRPKDHTSHPIVIPRDEHLTNHAVHPQKLVLCYHCGDRPGGPNHPRHPQGGSRPTYARTHDLRHIHNRSPDCHLELGHPMGKRGNTGTLNCAGGCTRGNIIFPSLG